MPLRHRLNEAIDSHRLHCVVGSALLADCAHSLTGRFFPHDDPRAVRWKHFVSSGRLIKLCVKRVEQFGSQFLRTQPGGRQQVGTTDIANEQRIAGKDPVRRCVGRFIDDSDRLWCVPGSQTNLKLYGARDSRSP